MKFGFYDQFGAFFNDVLGSVDSAILNKSLQSPDVGLFFNWAAFYQKMSFFFSTI
jgi:hypothetical protein